MRERTTEKSTKVTGVNWLFSTFCYCYKESVPGEGSLKQTIKKYRQKCWWSYKIFSLKVLLKLTGTYICAHKRRQATEAIQHAFDGRCNASWFIFWHYLRIKFPFSPYCCLLFAPSLIFFLFANCNMNKLLHTIHLFYAIIFPVLSWSPLFVLCYIHFFCVRCFLFSCLVSAWKPTYTKKFTALSFFLSPMLTHTILHVQICSYFFS